MVSSMLHSLSEVPRIAKFRPMFSLCHRKQKERISMSKALSPEVRVPYALVARWASPPGCSLRHWVVRRFVVLHSNAPLEGGYVWRDIITAAIPNFIGFNPCFNGRWSRTRTNKKAKLKSLAGMRTCPKGLTHPSHCKDTKTPLSTK